MKLEEEAEKFLASPKKLEFGSREVRVKAVGGSSAQEEEAGRTVLVVSQIINAAMEDAVHVPTPAPTVEVHANVVPLEPISAARHGEREAAVAQTKSPDVSSIFPIIFQVGQASPKKPRKLKHILRKKPNDAKVPIQVENCCVK